MSKFRSGWICLFLHRILGSYLFTCVLKSFTNTLIDIVSKNVCISANLNIRLLIVYTSYISLLFWSFFLSFSLIYIGNIADTNQSIVLFMDGSENYIAEALALRYSVKKVFLEISQNSQENICARFSFLIKFIKKEALAQVFSCEFWNILRTSFFTEHLRWLLLTLILTKLTLKKLYCYVRYFFFYFFYSYLLFDA